MILIGAVLMAGVSLAAFSDGTWKGDFLFVSAGFLGSIYAVRMRRSGLTAIQGAAFISVYSMLLYLPVYCLLWLGASRLPLAPAGEVAFQALYQGVLMGAFALFSFSRAILNERAREGVRSSIRPVFEAIACNNPYALDQFDSSTWNQMVVKCVFAGADFETIIGLAERRNSELVQMLEDLVEERRVAGRPSPECVRRYIAGT